MPFAYLFDSNQEFWVDVREIGLKSNRLRSRTGAQWRETQRTRFAALDADILPLQ